MIAEAPGHGQPWDVLVEVPNTGGTEWVALHVPVSSDAATCIEDSLLLVGLVGLVVPVQRDAYHFVLAWTAGDFLSSGESSPRIAYIGAEHFVANDKHAYAG